MSNTSKCDRMKMPRLVTVGLLLWYMAMTATLTRAYGADDLAQNFSTPPHSAKPSCFWWWSNSNVDKTGITRDLEESKAKGMGGVTLICARAGGPRGPVFLSPEWRELYKHAVNECARLDLELGVNFCGMLQKA